MSFVPKIALSSAHSRPKWSSRYIASCDVVRWDGRGGGNQSQGRDQVREMFSDKCAKKKADAEAANAPAEVVPELPTHIQQALRRWCWVSKNVSVRDSARV
jgi:hypothetical protein